MMILEAGFQCSNACRVLLRALRNFLSHLALEQLGLSDDVRELQLGPTGEHASPQTASFLRSTHKSAKGAAAVKGLPSTAWS